jgi:hypothetical protein
MYATTFYGDLEGTAKFAKQWKSARTVTFKGDVTGNFSIDGSSNVGDVELTVTDYSHKHYISDIDDLQKTLGNIDTALGLKAPLASPALTGTPTAPTATEGTKTTQIATTAFVANAVNKSFAANDAMLFKGTIGTNGTVTSLPNSHNTGWTYRVITAGTYAGVKCEIGDLIICIADGTAASNSHWTVAQTNIDGAIIRDVTTAVGSTTLPVYVNASGVVKPLTYSLNASVPADAKFTDTTYTLSGKASGNTWVTTLTPSTGTATTSTVPAVTTSAAGLMIATDKSKLNYTNIAYGTCSTAAATAAKVITVSGNSNWALTAGSLITIMFTNTNTAESPTFNVNGSGAKNVFYANA